MNEGLIEQIREDPESEEAYLVMSDVLLEKGDPRGELILLHHMLGGTHRHERRTFRSSQRRTPMAWREASGADLWEEAERLVNENARHFFGNFGKRMELDWFMGYAHRARLADEFRLRESDAVKALTDLFSHPTGLFLRELVCTDVFSGDATKYTKLLAAIHELAPSTLTGVVVGSQQERNPIGDLSPLLTRGLSYLEVHGWRMEMRSGTHTDVGELHIDAREPNMDLVDGFVGSNWPNLSGLGIWFEESAIAQRFLEAKMPKLEKLWITRCDSADKLVVWLSEHAKFLKNLKRLSITSSQLSDVGAAHLAERASSTYKHLESLDTRSTSMTMVGIVRLREAFGERVRTMQKKY